MSYASEIYREFRLKRTSLKLPHLFITDTFPEEALTNNEFSMLKSWICVATA